LNCTLSEQRKKPLGTAHALWCCRELITDSFAVINADDFYGKQAFALLLNQTSETPNDYLMVAYQLQNTLSDFGGVNRGLCKLNELNYLTAIEECEQIKANKQGISGVLSSNNSNIKLSPECLISMNCWFFNPDIFVALELALTELLTSIKNHRMDVNQECYLPSVVMQQIEQKNRKVKVLSTGDSWFGLTYPQDSKQVNEKVTALFSKK